MHRAGFILTLAAGFFSVFLLSWQGYNGASADWVFGFLAAFWSMIMMLRLMTLTAPAEVKGASSGLAQKIVETLRLRQEDDRQIILENAFGGSFVLFLFAGLVFAAWQVFCATFPAQSGTFDGLEAQMARFLDAPLSAPGVFDWGQGFLLFLSFSMMAFVLRSHAPFRSMTRPALLVLCGYAVAGYIALSGLGAPAKISAYVGLVGNGDGALSYLVDPAQTASLFDILLLESGIGGLALLTFLLFIPLGYISLSAQQGRTDTMILCCGIVTGIVLILSAFLAFTPPVAGFMTLCAMGLFLAWGASETSIA